MIYLTFKKGMPKFGYFFIFLTALCLVFIFSGINHSNSSANSSTKTKTEHVKNDSNKKYRSIAKKSDNIRDVNKALKSYNIGRFSKASLKKVNGKKYLIIHTNGIEFEYGKPITLAYEQTIADIIGIAKKYNLSKNGIYITQKDNDIQTYHVYYDNDFLKKFKKDDFYSKLASDPKYLFTSSQDSSLQNSIATKSKLFKSLKCTSSDNMDIIQIDGDMI